MKERTVYISPEAEADLLAIYAWIADAGAPDTALGYIERIEQYCNKLNLASERGQRRDDLGKGLRVVGFERSATIAFYVTDAEVHILRVFYGGQDWEQLL